MVEGANYRLSEGDINKLCGKFPDLYVILDKFREGLPDNWEGHPTFEKSLPVRKNSDN
jgi:hypothetical protein